ncbi:hypothetical protein MTQ01_12410 [Streptomyces sp. XM4193]|uniref:divisome protein SepX/GlpR n=1 Tax=Streptomyces sp. XM4193 TaxID=2929782 RepID=UPI001FF7322C|nr:gephyrin-like molybdotransferase receptor GlpR [Streptomyces sp. XM4193]MCK1796804.1 hypothetical protein [Streptomyces sp. XM4193]
MSNSGLIYAVIVGAWAAYLVPMWLRRQDELNDARPTERFSTAIRLLSGRAAMERRYTRTRAKAPESPEDDDDSARPDESGSPEGDTSYEAADLRSFADPVTEIGPVPTSSDEPHDEAGDSRGRPEQSELPAEFEEPETRKPVVAKVERAVAKVGAGDARTKRARVLARRRRTTMLLFLWFTAASVLAAVGGLGLLWAPAIPALLLSAYIGYLRAQERRRFAVRLDRQRAEAAARRLQEKRRLAQEARNAESDAGPALSEDGQAIVEQTDHAEWVDQQRARRRDVPAAGSWDPVPVPLPTYVNAPVAPRSAERVDFDAADAWSSARSTTAGPAQAPAAPRAQRRTPLFDQDADVDRPRASGE